MAYQTDQNFILFFNTFNIKFIPLYTKNERKLINNIQELNSRISNLELSFLDLTKENIQLKEKIRLNNIEIHYLKSINNKKIVKYNYQEIKNRNKQLNQEFKRVYKLISKNIGFNLISQ